MFQRFFTETDALNAVRSLVLSLAATLVLPAAIAQGQTPDQPPTAEMLRAGAEQMIAAAGGEPGLFQPESQAPAIGIRHTRSGLLCRFAYGGEGRLTIFDSSARGIAHGDNVACGMNTPLGATTLYATRNSAATLDSALAESVQALLALHPNAQPLDLSTLPSATNPSAPLPPEYRSAAFSFTHQGRQTFTRVSVHVANGWVYKLRFTSGTPQNNWAADLFWHIALEDLRNYTLPQPVQ